MHERARWHSKKLRSVPLGLFFLAVLVTHVLAFDWGADWKPWGKCPTCGQWFKHVGTDIFAKAGRNVYFDGLIDGTVKQVFQDQAKQFFWCVVLENKTRNYTFVVWHLDKVTVKPGQKITGKTKLGVVADFAESVSPDHIHLGMRYAPFDTRLSSVGALPGCAHKPKGLPQFPEKFAPPNKAFIVIE